DSNSDFGLRHFEHLHFIGFSRKPFLNGLADILQSFLACAALRMATFERRATDRNSVFVLDESDAVMIHGFKILSFGKQIKRFRRVDFMAVESREIAQMTTLGRRAASPPVKRAERMGRDRAIIVSFNSR